MANGKPGGGPMALSGPLQAAVNNVAAALIAAYPWLDQARLTQMLTDVTQSPPDPVARAYVHLKLSWMVNGGGAEWALQIPAGSVSPGDITLLKNAWGV